MTIFEVISVIVAVIALPSFFYGIFKVSAKNMEELDHRRREREKEQKNIHEHIMHERKIKLHI